MFALFTLVGILFVFAILLIIYNYTLNPYLQLRYYAKQGASAKFYKELVSNTHHCENVISKGDYYYDYKQRVSSNPDLRMLVENFGSRCSLILLDPKLIKEMLAKPDIYQKDKLFYAILNRMSTGSTFLAEGDEWRKSRRLISSAFNFEFLKQMIPMIMETTQEKLDSWVEQGKLKDLEILYPLGEITGEITGRLFFGKEFGQYKINGESMINAVQRLLVATLHESFSPSFLILGPKFSEMNILPRHRKMNKDLRDFRDACKKIIQETEKETSAKNNLLSVLLNHRKQNVEDNGLTDEQITGEFTGLFAAGTDTTSHLINSAIYFLCKYPQVLKKVKEEVDREFSDLTNFGIDNLNRMDYLTAVLKETLRLGGPIDTLFFREAVQDDQLGDIKIKKGTIVNMCHIMHFSSEKYYNDPNAFIPERWLSNKDPAKAEPYVYLPFSAGPRNCIGQHLAMIEAKTIVGLIVKRFDFSIPEDYKMVLTVGFLFEPSNPIKVTLVPKEIKG